jgi:predicted transcriptional regulator
MKLATLGTTADRIVSYMETRYKAKEETAQDGRKYRSNSPLRPNSDSMGFEFGFSDDGESGWYTDYVSGDKGSLYDLAGIVGIERPARSDDFDATWDYFDESGKLIYQVVKFYDEQGKKQFRQRHPCTTGEWTWGLGGNPKRCSCPKIQPSLYRLPELMAAQPGNQVILTEGEKDADTARRLGYLATSASMGAGKFHKIGNRMRHFKGLNVIITPDEDKTGLDDASDKARALVSFAAGVKVVRLPGLIESSGQDLTDWINNVGSKEALDRLIEAAPIWTGFRDSASFREAATNGTAPATDPDGDAPPVALSPQGFTPARSLKVLSTRDILTNTWPEPVWAVPGILPAGLTFLAGKPKIGKSWLVLQLCLALASGGQFLGQRVEKGKVLYLALEDTPRRLKDRMDKQGWTADLLCNFLTIGSFKDEIGDFRHGGAQVLAEAIRAEGYKLVAIDTFSRTVFTNQLEQHEMSAILEPLQTMAHQVNAALLITDHMAKNAGMTKDPVIDIYGSVAKGATLDTAWGLYRDRSDDRAELVIDGRDIDGQKAMAIYFDGMLGCWQYQGEADSVKVTERRKQIMGVIHNEGPIINKELADLLELPKSNIYEYVSIMIKNGWVEKDEKKRYTLTDEGRKIIEAK